MKNIICYKIPNNMRYSQIKLWHDNINKLLDNEYILIGSPFDLNCISGDVKIINIDTKEYSYNELMETIEKANMYDDLCK
jgi:hypothetical protein